MIINFRNLRIVVPAKATELERFAADELSYFVKQATGSGIVLVPEYEPTADAFDSIVSIGETELFKKKCNLKELKARVGEDGYKIIMNEKELYICGGAGQGTIYGVYKALQELFNLDIYTGNEFYIDKKPLEFHNFEIEDKPDIPMRAMGVGNVHKERRYPGAGDKTYIYRMRLRAMDEGWGINNHTYFRILPPSKYHEAHPDWYDKNVRTLCYSNQEMITQYVENMKVIIEHTPNDSLYMIGMEDNLGLCDCENCKKLNERFNGNQCASMLWFTNQVVNKLNAWLKEKYPEREVYFFAFAYYWAELPPVEKDENGEFKLLFEELKPADNFGVLIACIHCNANYPLSDRRNFAAFGKTYAYGNRAPAIEVYKGWSAVVKNIASWNYNLNFYDYVCPCPMWNFLENDTFKLLKSVGTRHMFLEAGCGDELANFARMKIYCVSKLMWDSSLDLHTLIRHFMKGYYEGASDELYAYFNYIHEHAKWLEKEIGRMQIFVHFDDEPNVRLMKKEYYPKEMLFKSLEYFDRATAKELTETVRDRVLLEALPAKYTLLYLYRSELEKDFANELIADLRYISVKMGVDDVQEEKPTSIFANLEAWEKEIN